MGWDWVDVDLCEQVFPGVAFGGDRIYVYSNTDEMGLPLAPFWHSRSLWRLVAFPAPLMLVYGNGFYCFSDVLAVCFQQNHPRSGQNPSPWGSYLGTRSSDVFFMFFSNYFLTAFLKRRHSNTVLNINLGFLQYRCRKYYRHLY